MYLYGIRGIVCEWFNSYLNNKSQYVSLNNCNSDILQIKCGVPIYRPFVQHVTRLKLTACSRVHSVLAELLQRPLPTPKIKTSSKHIATFNTFLSCVLLPIPGSNYYRPTVDKIYDSAGTYPVVNLGACTRTILSCRHSHARLTLYTSYGICTTAMLRPCKLCEQSRQEVNILFIQGFSAGNNDSRNPVNAAH